nr:MAG TPA: protein of unknown function (DUF5052) [Caudoviricetes sp.]
MKKKLVAGILMAALAVSCLTGCEGLNSEVNDLNGSITGNTYNASFYTNEGEKFMDMTGQKIDLDSNIVEEETYSDGSWGYTKKLSSVVTVTIDGKEVENCGTTMIFAENGLNPDVDFQSPEVINSKTDGSLGENVIIASVVNRFKNYFGKARVVVIQSQLGDPICAYSGDSVYYEVCEDLPKTTKLMIDGKALYIHRANFQIIDKELLN